VNLRERERARPWEWGRGGRGGERELHNDGLHNLCSNIMVKEGKANHEARPPC
jgi:hypothetical protein